jgi:type 1 glutamine amidotransferase
LEIPALGSRHAFFDCLALGIRTQSTVMKHMGTRYLALASALAAALALVAVASSSNAAEAKRIVLVAGTPSHGPLDHEFNAGCLLLKKCLDAVPGVEAVVHLNGWPKDESIFDGAAAILIYCDGGGGHPAIQEQRLARLGERLKKGVGLACAHYAVEVPKDRGGREFLDWIGGYFETHWSVNPHWTAQFKNLPVHPITRGVRPFEINDEWYFHMRFRDDRRGLTPILSAVAPAETMSRPDGPHSGNAAVRQAVRDAMPQIVAWAFERPDGGRGFGFTGGHRHLNWGNDDFRRTVLNALLWIAKVDVPPGGVASKITEADLMANLDPKQGRRPGASTAPRPKKVLLLAGKPSHGPGDHEFRAGSLLLKKCLDRVPDLQTEVHTLGWPQADTAFDDAAAVVIYADGGAGHPAIQANRLALLDRLAKKGVGLGFAHYGVEVPAGDPGNAMQEWIGGYYEHQFSVNPMWAPDFSEFPTHPVTRGVKPFQVLDEWYFNMRFREDRKGITPILVAKPSSTVRGGPYVWPRGPYPHIVDAAGREEVMMWVRERDNGGRGFGFTGGHKHVNWADPNFRKVMLNAILWIAKQDVPADGVNATVAPEDLAQNMDPKDAPASPGNLTGAWSFTVETAAGSGTPSFNFTHAGANLIGNYQGLLGQARVIGTVKGPDVEFWFTVALNDAATKVVYKGKFIDAQSMQGTVNIGDYAGTWTAKR